MLCFVDEGNAKVWAHLKNIKYNTWDKDICWIPLGVHKACNRKIAAIGFEEKGWAFYKICNIWSIKSRKEIYFGILLDETTIKIPIKLFFSPLITRFSEKRSKVSTISNRNSKNPIFTFLLINYNSIRFAVMRRKIQ